MSKNKNVRAAKATRKAEGESGAKTCFVIMPISEVDGYPVGHFTTVYDYLIKPACIEAGFTPHRADLGNKTEVIMLDVIRQLIEADMVLCDLSTKNPNVMYELGMRQAFNKPVALIKDSTTERVFDTQLLRDAPYDESLRADRVQADIERIAATLVETYEDDEPSSLISLLGVQPAMLSKRAELSQEDKLLLDTVLSLQSMISTMDTRLQRLAERVGNQPPLPVSSSDPRLGLFGAPAMTKSQPKRDDSILVPMTIRPSRGNTR